ARPSAQPGARAPPAGSLPPPAAVAPPRATPNRCQQPSPAAPTELRLTDEILLRHPAVTSRPRRRALRPGDPGPSDVNCGPPGAARLRMPCTGPKCVMTAC